MLCSAGWGERIGLAMSTSASVIRFLCVAVTRLDAARSRLVMPAALSGKCMLFTEGCDVIVYSLYSATVALSTRNRFILLSLELVLKGLKVAGELHEEYFYQDCMNTAINCICI